MKEKRRGVLRGSTKRVAKKQTRTGGTNPLTDEGPTPGLLCRVLELGAASVWRYLTLEEISSIIRAIPGALSQDLVDAVALKAIDEFAEENKTHLGGECKCDWMRNLHFTTGLEARNRCRGTPPFTLDKTIPVLQTPRSSQALLAALLLGKKLLDTVSWANRFANPAYYPVVRPLLLGGGRSLRSKAAVTRAMNVVCSGAGSHFFYKTTKAKRSARSPDFLYEHWDGMNGTSCQYCDDLVDEAKKEDGWWEPKEVENIRANCKKMYRPLKTQMLQNLRFVRCVRRPHRSVGRVFAPYKGLVAGITSDGVLCGLYINIGSWGDE
ncbi:unnamed protein product [Phytophthora fragariaefolia]|uniref:Unnamed protein product n=1 Tax=Phytophthora fragariaefolia TaxID=1490495 RepID=A0A9W6XJH9_9STRA|nr:unnamed protein product [Phytophthora fragariaefolia]